MLRKQIQRVRGSLESNGVTSRLIVDRRGRTMATASASFALNALYAAGNLMLGALNASAWLATMGAYYLVIAASRAFVVRREATLRVGRRADDRGVARVVGILLIGMTVILSCMVSLMVTGGREVPGDEVIVISQATYTFIKVGVAVRGRILARGAAGDPLIKTLATLSFVDAFVSLLSLQATMISTFGGDESFRLTMTGATGAVVCALCIIAGALLIAGGRRSGGTDAGA